MLTTGVGLTQLAKHLPSAGGYYTYISRTIGPRAGFLTAWLFFLYTASTPAFALVMMGWVLESSLRAEYGLVFPWRLFLLFGTLFTFWATYRKIEVSAAALMVLGSLEMGIVMLLAAWGLFVPGPGGVSLAVVQPDERAERQRPLLGDHLLALRADRLGRGRALGRGERTASPGRAAGHRGHDPDHGRLSGLHVVGNHERLGDRRHRSV